MSGQLEIVLNHPPSMVAWACTHARELWERHGHEYMLMPRRARLITLGNSGQPFVAAGNGAGGPLVIGGSPRSRREMSARMRGSTMAPKWGGVKGGLANQYGVWPGGAAYCAPTISSPRCT